MDQFEEMMHAEFPDGVAEHEPDKGTARLPMELQSLFWGSEAMLQAIGSMHCGDFITAKLGDAHPQWPAIAQLGPVQHFYAETHEGGHLGRLDYLYALRPFVIAMAEAFSEWMDEHKLPDHIHLWVYLTGVGAMPLVLGHGEGVPTFTMPLPGSGTLSLRDGQVQPIESSDDES